MNFSVDVLTEFNDLKRAYSCELCGNVLQTPVILKTCNHELCKECMNQEQQRCPVCKNPYCERDVDDDDFTENVLKVIKNIDRIFSASLIRGGGDDGRGFKIAIARSIMKKNFKGETPLHTSCKLGKFDKVEELIQSGVDLNVTDNANWTPLHEAIESNNYDCAKLLLRNGALTDVPGDLYATPLHKAASMDLIDIAKLLLSYGADAKCLDYSGKAAVELSQSHDMTNLLENVNKTNCCPTCFIAPTAILYTTDISKENKDEMTKCNAKFVTSREFHNKDDVTHFILVDEEKLSLNTLIAIVKGSFIVDEKWIGAFLQSQNLISFDFIVDSYRNAVCKSVSSKLKRLPKLFDGISFNIFNHEKPVKVHNMDVTKKDLTTLIQAGGGKVVIRPPTLRTVEGFRNFPFHVEKDSALSTCCHYIIYSKYNPPELLYQANELRHKSSEWLIDCILNFCISE